mmetsp:Transcript_18339/g.62371  ORF Transcript_18339/g.62371 Transcript_18339/m.62371 type:complete len:327 (-) Transcript_18339:5453-6433(-)
MVAYWSGLGRLTSFRNRMSRSSLGRMTRPRFVVTGLPHTCTSFCTMFAAVVWALQLTTAVDAPRISEKQSSSRSALPQPSGPATRNGSPLSSHGLSSALFCSTESTCTRPPTASGGGGLPEGAASRSPASRHHRPISCASSLRVSRSRFAPKPRASPRQNSFSEVAEPRCESALRTMPSLVVLTTAVRWSTHARALWKYSPVHFSRLERLVRSWKRLHQLLTNSSVSTAASERKIMPVREMVAGEANLRSSHSNTKLTLFANWMRSPEGRVSRRLSSSTELRASIHSGSTSPSQMIHECCSCGSFTTARAEAVSTPSNHSLVSMSM